NPTADTAQLSLDVDVTDWALIHLDGSLDSRSGSWSVTAHLPRIVLRGTNLDDVIITWDPTGLHATGSLGGKDGLRLTGAIRPDGSWDLSATGTARLGGITARNVLLRWDQTGFVVGAEIDTGELWGWVPVAGRIDPDGRFTVARGTVAPDGSI